MRVLTLTLPLALLTACGNASNTPEFSAEHLDSAAVTAPDGSFGTLAYRGGLVLTHEDEAFGGWSGLEILDDGSQLVAVSDNGQWLTAQLDWDENDRLGGIGELSVHPILGRNGEPLLALAGDAESLALLDDGRLAVSFEHQARINLYSSPDTAADGLPAPRLFGKHLNNEGLTGLTALPDGRLLAGAEAPRESEGPKSLWLQAGDGWSELCLKTQSGFGLTALDAAGDWIYGLERHWTAEDGVSINIFRFPVDGLSTDAVIYPEMLATLRPDAMSENFEGLSVIERDGKTWLVLFSDDNFNAEQQTLLVAFELTETS